MPAEDQTSPQPQGLGCAPIGCGPCGGVYELLGMGFPRLALAKAKGVPFAPYVINVRATFDNPDVSNIPNVGSDVEFTNDIIIDAAEARVTIDRTPTGALDTLSDFFFNYQSGIEVTLDVLGAPRYAVAPKFTPLSTLVEMVNSRWPHGWGLTYQQQLQMDFNARIALPNFPVTVVVTFRGWEPIGEAYAGAYMSTAEAIDRLVRECGIQVPACYSTTCK